MTVPTKTRIRKGAQGDMTAVLALLTDAGLPTADFTDSPDITMWVLEADGSIRGVIALQRFGREALLRSLTLAASHRRRGHGRDLVARVEDEAAAAGVDRLVLLTESAERFFRRLGYRPVERARVGESLRQSAEFRFLCPASAVCLGKSLRPNGTPTAS